MVEGPISVGRYVAVRVAGLGVLLALTAVSIPATSSGASSPRGQTVSAERVRHKSTRDWLPALVALVGLVGIAAMFSISSRSRPEEAEDVVRRPEPEPEPHRTPPVDAAPEVVDAGPVAGATEPRAPPPSRLRLAHASLVFAWRTLRYSQSQRYVVCRRALSYLLLALVAIVLAVAIVSALD